uniref:Uncharacterized protein n=1 Tax=Arundo donax TaxID=35708 RepID=A0A0A9FMT4_ARUDO
MNKMTQHKILNQLTVPDSWIFEATNTRIQKIYGFLESGAVPNETIVEKRGSRSTQEYHQI